MSAPTSVASREYVSTMVSGILDGVALNTNSVTPDFAFTTTSAAPLESAWRRGVWSSFGGYTYARLLIGPGTPVVLTAGPWYVWLRVNGAIERPLRLLGIMTLTV